ncbi:MAG: hypothetical protein HC848_02890 [Limnobacter sp.]|nr:hypothetical protein [Limnobacter sp.]
MQAEGKLPVVAEATKNSPLQGRVLLDLAKSTLGGTPFQAVGELSGTPERIELTDLRIAILGNSLVANGVYGKDSPGISAQINAPNLAQLEPLAGQPVGGLLHADLLVQGEWPELTARYTLNAKSLRWGPNLALENAQGQGQIGLAPDSIWEGKLSLKNLRLGPQAEQTADAVQITLHGTRSAHSVSASVSTEYPLFARRRALGLALTLNGGLTSNQQGQQSWQGQLQKLAIEGLWQPVRSLTLQAPAQLQIAANGLRLEALTLTGEDGSQLTNQLLSIQGNALKIQGNAPKIGMPRASSLLKQQVTLETKNLVLALDWSYEDSPARLQGLIDVRHVSGGFAILSDAELEVPVQALNAQIRFDRQAIAAVLDINAPGALIAQGDIRLPVRKNAQTHRWEVAYNAPMQGALATTFLDMGWVGPLVDPALKTSGTGQVALAVAGTLDAPLVEGRVFARNFDLTQLDQGIRLEDGVVTIDFNNDRARIQELDFTVYNRQAPKGRLEELGPLIQGVGKVSASGQWFLNGEGGGIEVKLDRVGLIQRPDRWIMTNAAISIQQPDTEDQPLKVRGEISALGAYVEMPESEPPSLGRDVVIRGQTQTASDALPLDVLIRADLGPLFFCMPKGLKPGWPAV